MKLYLVSFIIGIFAIGLLVFENITAYNVFVETYKNFDPEMGAKLVVGKKNNAAIIGIVGFVLGYFSYKEKQKYAKKAMGVNFIAFFMSIFPIWTIFVE